MSEKIIWATEKLTFTTRICQYTNSLFFTSPNYLVFFGQKIRKKVFLNILILYCFFLSIKIRIFLINEENLPSLFL